MKTGAGIRVDVQPFQARNLLAPLCFEDDGICGRVFPDDGQLYLGPYADLVDSTATTEL
jgi:hypothetical protein